ncbi:MAG TPA: plastocyanin/azurin family copper-binding protein [Thermoleophilaceae bacterium]|nr:plastocyanin/azurin family copper-binding protein [Thermoleophilaceae bacterium]
MKALAAALLALALLAAPAQADSIIVSAGTSSFDPGKLDVLVGDTVIWRNNSTKTHNVKAETAGYNSGRFGPRTAVNHVFATAGVYPYVCTIHDGMTGDVGVYPLLLGGPRRPVQPGASVALHVRGPESAGEVTIEADTGSGYQPVAVAGPPEGGGHDGHVEPGTLHANVVATQTATYRAVSAAGASQQLRVEVSAGPALALAARSRAGRAVIDVRARPASPRTRVVLQLRLRERFGWWAVARARLDRRSRAQFTVRGHRGVPARVVSVGADWATVLSKSRVLKLTSRG